MGTPSGKASMAAAAAFGLILGAQVARGGQAPAEGPSIWDGVYTDAQAARGERRYKASCETCHAEDLLGGSGPALVGEPFLQRWDRTTVADMLATLRQTMPQDSPDSLGTAGYVDLIAFLLKSNGAPPGAAELPAEAAGLQRVRNTLRAAAR